MKKFDEFLDKYYRKIFLVLLVLIFVNTCGNPNKVTNKRLDTLTTEIESLQSTTVSKKEIQIEGLKAEKRMIQSTDRKMLDVNRQAEIDKEIEKLSK
jgi:Tfp pilus assembly protein PilO